MAEPQPRTLPEDRQPVIIAARRTPICRAHGALKSLHAHELLSPVLRALLGGTGVAPASVADVVIGNAVGGGGNVARLAALEAGLPVSVPGLTVDRQCGSGLDAIVLASSLVAAGGSGLYLAGGVESISTAPLRARRNSDGAPEFFSRAQFAPQGLGDPDMGSAAENVAARFGISRERQDELALRSHRRALASAAAGVFDGEIVPLAGVSGVSGPGGARTVSADDGPRRGLTGAVLARFPPAFAAGGTVTAGNSCFDADAAAAVVITSVQRARELGARDGLLVRGTDTAGVDPQLLGIGAAVSAERLLERCGITAAALGLVEFNEAFASQTLACLDRLGIPADRANLDGGALALGHAYGASGAVLVTRLLAQARRSPVEGQLALALISIAGGMGTAALLEYRSLS
ncbi:acetyl-CoA C-acetyltransferase [Arthrobacter ginsengisoli]|uniref:Acetyl-CoA C-acetyltransferase n=1 Tax=Arthrobacter ginsengisoli TaxID=1356565 RepID=A0ABU1UCI2_9MICC|nr:thiolase family protein [Arthrobacter ginsengisoli]MDR7082896.1 acetyl-CoA C-acetyltransferase [Arthrobacter ginsengisoli]